MKRAAEGGGAASHSNKKPKHQNIPHGRHYDIHYNKQGGSSTPATSHLDALSQLPPPTSISTPVPAYTHFTVSASVPPLPPIQDTSLSRAPFKHKSTTTYHRSASATQSSSTPADLTYERLEFVGDAYIELIATRLIFERYPHLPAGRQSQLRELLVKNETLAEYSRMYGFEKRVEVGSLDRMLEDGKHKGNKGFNKVLGDVFEAYLAAIVLSDVEDGFSVAEKWMTALWAPKLLEAAKADASYRIAAPSLTHDSGEDVSAAPDPLTTYNPTAKAELQKRVLGGSDVRLSYEPYRDSVELKGDQLGQNKHFVAVYLTGYGYERECLGQGQGKNKVEAGNWAATEAMWGHCRSIVEACEEKLRRKREERDAAKVADRQNGSDKEVSGKSS